MLLPPGSHFLHPNIPIHVFEGEAAGPTVIMQAGIHGNEIAGVHALEELLEEGLRPERGRLLVIPTMNRAAYRLRERATPEGLDLNRSFPGDANAERVELRLARLFMDLMLREKPTLMATLHESHKRYDPERVPSFGQSLVYGVDPMPPILGRTVSRLNDNRQPKSDVGDETWAELYYPVATSSTEVIVEATGCIGICVETWMGFPEVRRIEMQKEVVRILLDEIGMTSFSH